MHLQKERDEEEEEEEEGGGGGGGGGGGKEPLEEADESCDRCGVDGATVNNKRQKTWHEVSPMTPSRALDLKPSSIVPTSPSPPHAAAGKAEKFAGESAESSREAA